MNAESAPEPVHDPRIAQGQCHAETSIGGAEFICIAPPHPDQPRTTEWSINQAIASASAPPSRRHYFIRKYPPT